MVLVAKSTGLMLIGTNSYFIIKFAIQLPNVIHQLHQSNLHTTWQLRCGYDEVLWNQNLGSTTPIQKKPVCMLLLILRS